MWRRSRGTSSVPLASARSRMSKGTSIAKAALARRSDNIQGEGRCGAEGAYALVAASYRLPPAGSMPRIMSLLPSLVFPQGSSFSQRVDTHSMNSGPLAYERAPPWSTP